jgi:hypothetical protein
MGSVASVSLAGRLPRQSLAWFLKGFLTGFRCSGREFIARRGNTGQFYYGTYLNIGDKYHNNIHGDEYPLEVIEATPNGSRFNANTELTMRAREYVNTQVKIMG